MHFTSAKKILTAYHSGMNVYRGCTHGCIYCDVRSRVYRCTHPIEDVEVKENASELLDAELRRRRKKCVVGTGAMGDPYQPCEAQLRLTRRCLEVIYRHGFGATIHTKSDALLEDIDILDAINRRAKCVVQTTLTTMDDALSRIIEPNVCTSRRRLEVLHILKARGIPSVVWLCPVLPYLTDAPENIAAILDGCAASGVRGIVCFGMGMTLREGDREYYYAMLDRHFLGLRERYEREYEFAYNVPSPRAAELAQLFRERCERYGILHDPDAVFRDIAALPSPRQPTLFD